MATFTGTDADDVFEGGDKKDVFDMAGTAGADRVSGGKGDDVIKGGANWNTSDTVDGGAGNDRLELAATYYRIDGLNFSDVETVAFDSVGAVQTLMRVWDTAIQSGETLTVDARKLGEGGWLRFEGQLETDGAFRVFDSAGDDYMSGGAGADAFHFQKGGADKAHGGAGNDAFHLYGTLDSYDIVDGGEGWDKVVLKGDYSEPLGLDAKTLNSVEAIELTKGSSYHLVLSDGVVGDYGMTIGVGGTSHALGAGNRVVIDASAVTSRNVALSDSTGDDILVSGGGDDDLTSYGGSDMLSGGAGNDDFALIGSIAGFDTIDGGEGYDELNLTELDRGVEIDLSAKTYGVGEDGGQFAGIEQITGTMHADTLVGSAEVYVHLAGGNDRASLGDGDDTCYGDAGDDRLSGGGGADYLAGGTGGDTLSGGLGNDSLYGDGGDDRLDGGAGADRLSGGSGRDVLAGGADNDSLDGGSENDVLNGGSGDDFLSGGTGDDRLTGGSGRDVFYFRADDGKDVVTDFQAGVDSLYFDVFNGLTFAQIKSHLSQQGDDVRIEYEGGAVILEDTRLKDLSAGDFSMDVV